MSAFQPGHLKNGGQPAKRTQKNLDALVKARQRRAREDKRVEQPVELNWGKK